ncbi:MAG TPA: hypothetical protein PL143_16170 [Rhodocyclaceae bacterium]|nr:hypothetical protein [Rhodocyclaceae bacterium]
MLRIVLIMSLGLAAGCSSLAASPQAALDSAPAAGAPTAALNGVHVNENGQLDFELNSGLYHCEWGLRVDVLRDITTRDRILIGWNGGRYQLDRDPSFSGLPRFEDRAHGLVWIDLPWKGVLLDGKTQKPLANDCKTA